MFIAIIVRQVSGRGPDTWVLFGIGALATVAVGVLGPAGAGAAIWDEGPTLLFLLGLFVLAQALQDSGALDHLARWLIGRAGHPVDLPLVLFVGLGLLSAVLVNDALVLMGVPLLIGVATRLRTNAKPLLLVLAFSVTVGSTLTPFGNPQNILVATASGLASPVATFFRYLALPTAINLVLGGVFLRWVYRRAMPPEDEEFARARAEAPALFPSGGWARRLRQYPVLLTFPATILLLVGTDLVSAFTGLPAIPIWEIAIVGAAATLLASPGRVTVVRRVNWTVLLLFAGLFVVVAGAVSGGVIQAIEGDFPIPGPGHPTAAVLAIVGTSLGGSQLVSNVPWVALQIRVLTGLGYTSGTPVIWMALAAGSTLAGNVTLLGAASNLLLVEASARRGVAIRLGDFVREGLPIFAITITVLLACLLVGL